MGQTTRRDFLKDATFFGVGLTSIADLFRLAEAHARNTSETDVYHPGSLKGLGSRYNVIKWGDGSKEVRISQAAHWRFFYYLTTDERADDIMHMVAESAGVAFAQFDPMREAEPHTPGEPLSAFALGQTGFAQKAITILLAQGGGIASPHFISGPNSLNPVEEDAAISTNEAPQIALSTIEILERCKDQLPSEAAVRTTHATHK